MAIAWSVKITVLDYENKHVLIDATRTDSADPNNPKVYHTGPMHIDTVAQRTAALDAIWALRSADMVLAAKIAAFAPTITVLEAAAKTNLEAREA